MRLNVFYNAYGKREFVGILDEQDNILFEYAPEFLDKDIELSPFMLPLQSGVFEDSKRTFDGLFGLFNDSLPDGWGCLLLDRALRKQGLSLKQITPLKRLSMLGKNAMGALEYEPAEESSSELYNNALNLDELGLEANKILQGESSEVLDALLNLNGSSGGARPKIVALVSDDKKSIIHGYEHKENYTPWLIKFDSSLDKENIGLIEYFYSIMAKNAGIEMPDTHLFPSKNSKGHFGVKRFDRSKNGKIHIHTACGLLHASHRYPTLDYENLIKLTLRLTKDVREVEKMVRLMFFNVKSGNKDDHSKNFSFMIDEQGQWKMTPAYDLTPSEGINGEQTAMVNGKGRNITDDDLITTASISGIETTKLKHIIAQTIDAIADYDKLKKEVE